MLQNYINQLPGSDDAPSLVQNKYYAADAVAIDIDKQVVTCTEDGVEEFDVKFDMLAIATGSQVCYLPDSLLVGEKGNMLLCA